MNDNRNLDEISIIRPILIVLLVLYHAFCTWTGAWKYFDGFEPNEAYRWIADVAYSFMLPMFVFQSGYVWAFQREVKSRKDSLKQLAIKKGKRLLIPSVVFSIAYILIFNQYQILGGNCIKLIYNILSGVAHMWFLPMLFWCFIISWILQKIQSTPIRYILVIVLTVFSIIPIPFGINRALGYLLYFQIGYDTLLNSNKNYSTTSSTKLIVIWSLFIVVFIFSNILKDQISVINENGSTIVRALTIELSMFIKIIYSLLGIAALYLSAKQYSSTHVLSSFTIKLGSLCFGVYLFQQFILQGLYNYTNLYSILGLYLPWAAFLIALIGSIILTYLLRLTPIGKKLI